jgi:tRNA threonylcarbamoyladenosine biosynthesis protein TsaB
VTGAAPAGPGAVPLFLGIETTTPLGGVALAGPDGLVAEHALDIRGSHAPRLMVAVDDLLAAAGVALGDLAGIGVSIGPGSFTGLRVGVATAQGLCRGADVPGFPVPTLEAVAWALPAALAPPGAVLAVAMRARRGEVYGAAFRPAGGTLEPLLAPVAVPTGDLAADLAALEVPLLLAGTAAAELAQGLPGGAAVTLAPAILARPRAAVVAWRAAVLHAAGEGVGPEGLLPRYLARSQAEEKAREAAGGASPG